MKWELFFSQIGFNQKLIKSYKSNIFLLWRRQEFDKQTQTINNMLRRTRFLQLVLVTRWWSNQASNQHGTPGGAKNFLRRTQIFKLPPIVSNYVQHIFPRWAKKFWGVFFMFVTADLDQRRPEGLPERGRLLL